MLANLRNEPWDFDRFQAYAFSNQEEHQELTEAIQKSLGITVPIISFYPIIQSSLGAWLWQHQTMHSQLAEVLNVAGNDISQLDFKDTRSIQAWTDLHFNEHYVFRERLGI